MNTNPDIIQEAKVISVDDELHAGRIKVIVKRDLAKCNLLNQTEEDCSEYAFPLLPKTFQSVPKKGEIVFVFNQKIDNDKSQKYYIGPLISQPQFFEKDNNGQSSSVLQDGSDSFNPLQSIDFSEETHGSFPKTNDIAVIGRKGEDVILKDDEIDLRCGIRTDGVSDNKNIIGNVLLNTMSPAYIQLKYNRSGITKGERTSARSVINVVADKINLISYKNKNNIPNLDVDLVQRGDLLKNENMEAFMKKLHELPYGDILCQYLTIFKTAFLAHVHPFPGLPPIMKGTPDMENLIMADFNNCLSPNVRIG